MMNLPPIIHKTIQQYRTLIIIGVLTFCIPTSIFANPSLNNIAAGQVTVEQTQTTTTVNQTSQKAILNWNSFNIGNGEHTHFQQPNGGVALNRINPTQGASEIYGRLTATGQIILVNPAGIYFGPNAYVNVGGLIASTANISNEDFLNGYYRFTNDPNFNGSIHNQGHIIAADNGLIALIGGAVNNEGMIQANMGYVALASGNEFTMSLAGNELVAFTVDEGVTGRAVDYLGNEIEDGIQNTGDILAHGGQVLVTAKAASGVLDHVINLEGRTEVVSAYTENGELILAGDTNSGVVRIAGEIDASGKRNGESGGNITITGYNILIDEGASVDVSGNVGGGKINVGGNYLGQGPLPTANAVVMRDGAKLNASAIDNGDGGTVILWSDHYSNVSGEILTRGGAASGDGGFIETSSKNVLVIGSLSIDATASVGATGEWLLDPTDIYIADSQANATTAGMVGTDNSADTGSGGDPDTFAASGAVGDSFLSTGNLETALAGANVIVRTDGGSGGDGDIFVVDNITWTSSNTLTFLADRYIQINAGISGINGSLSLSAANLAQSITTDYTNGSIDVYNFNITAGHWYQNNATLPTFNVRGSFETNSGNGPDFTSDSVSFLRAVAGDGSTGNPYELTDVYGLQGMGSSDANLDYSYELANDIDASSTRNWRSGEGFRPVGDASLFTFTPSLSYLSDFNGNFDGQGHVIDGLYLNSNDNGVAMFGLASSNPGQFISNVGLTNVDITSISSTSLDTAALIASFSGSTISNVYVTGTIRNNDTRTDGSVGAIAGQLSGTLTNSYNAATIIINNTERAGGLVGYNHGTITNSYNIGDVIKNTTGGSAGGLVGHNDTFSTVERSYNAGNVSGGSATGGLVGVNMGNGFSGGTITNSYNIGSVTGTIAGGIAGTSQEDSEVSFSYNSGAVSGIMYEGGVLGRNINTVTLNNLFFDSDTSGVTVAIGNGTDTITATGAGCFTGTGCAAGTADLSHHSTFTGWSITNVAYDSAVDENLQVNRNATPPGTTWLIFNEATRPMLESEWSEDVRTAHQLQLMGAAVDADYTLVADIDLSSALGNAADVWNSTSSGTTADQGFYPIGYTDTTNPDGYGYGNGAPIGSEFTGSLNGDGHIIDNLYMNYESGNAAGIVIAGLFGGIDGTQSDTVIEKLSLTNVNITSLEGAGALAGTLGDGTISQVYVTGSVTGLGGPDPYGGVGGVVGSVVPSNALIENSYAEVDVTSTDAHGAFTGWFNEGSAVIRDSYATGTVGAGGHGFAYVPGGYAGTLTDNYFDSDTTGTTSGVTTGVAAFTTAQMRDFNTAGIYNTWDITTTPSTTATKPGNAWIMFDDITRPILLMEHRTEIETPHQLQLMGSTLGADYSLQNDINMNDAMTNPADVWGTNTGGPSGAGFAPIGNSTNRFSGNFNGNNNVVSNLYFASGSGSGFFGGTSSTANIQNLGLENINIIGGGNTVGGIVASNLGTITNSYVSGSISGGANIGGIAGYNNGIITNSYNTANVQAAGSYLNSMGGITGYNDTNGIVTVTFNSGLINTINDGGAFSAYGGLVGTNIGSINTSYNTGNVYGYTNFNGNSGGIAGRNSGIITNTYNTGSVRVPFNTTITNTGFGGIAGGNSGTISDSYSIGYVVKPGGTNYTGGLVGNNAGTVTNSFWDTATSGQSIAVENGSSAGMAGGCYTTSSCANGGTVNLTQETNFTGWDFSNTWNIVEDNSYPYLDAFYQANPNIISGTTGLAANNSVVVAYDSAAVNTTYTRANGAFYEIYGNNLITGIDSSIATNTPTLLYLSGAAHDANLVALADSVTSFVNSDLTTPDKFQVGHTTASTLSFTNLATAVGSLSNSDILYSASGNDITLSSGIDLNTDTNTTLDVNGNLTMTGSGELTLAGPVNLTVNNPVFTVTANSNISGIVNDAANTYGFTKEGAGTLVLSANNTYDGDTTITAGELRAGTDTALGTGIIILNGGRLGSDTTTVTLANNVNVTANSEIRVGFGANLNLDGVVDDIGNTYDISLFDTGFLSLFGDNSNFDGDFIVPGGTILVAQHNNALGSNVGGVIANSGQLRIYGGIDIGNEAITLNGGTLNGESVGTAISSGPITVIGSGILSTGNSNTLDVQGAITESGGGASFTVSGNGTVILSGNNTYTGTTTISNGTLQVGNGGTTGSTGSGSIVNNSNIVFDRSDDFTLANAMSGTGSLTKNNTNTLTLSTSNSYSGGTTINAGTLQVTHTNGVGTTGAILVNDGATFEVDLSGGTLANSSTLTLNGSGVGGVGAFYASAPESDTFTNPIVLGSNSTLQLNGSGATRSNLNGAINLNSFDLSLIGFGGNMGGVISGTGSLINSTATGSSWMSATNTYTGGTVLNSGGFFIASGANLGTGALTFNGGRLSLYFPADTTISNAIILNTNAQIDVSFAANDTINFTGGTTGTGALTVRNNASSNLTLNFDTTAVNHSGAITFQDIGAGPGSGTVNFNSNIGSNVTNITTSGGDLALVLAGTNTFTGDIIISDGIVRAGSASGIPTTADVSLGNVADTVFDLNGFDVTIASLAGGGATGGNVTLGANTLTTGDANNTTYSGIISGTGSLIKQDTGTFTLNGANTYSGGTTISSGTINASDDDALGTGAVTVSSVGTLELQNGVNVANDLSLNGTNALTATGSGTATFSGTITLGANTTFSTGSGSTLSVGVINGTGDGTESLTLNGSGSFILGGAVGNGVGTTLSALTANRPTTLSAGNFTTAGLQDYNSSVTVGGDTTLTSTGGSIRFDSTFSGSESLVIDAATTANFVAGTYSAEAIDVTAPSGITITGGNTTFTTSGIDAAGNFAFNNLRTHNSLGNRTTINTTNGGSITLSSLTGQGGVTANASGSANARINLSGSHYNMGNTSNSYTAQGGIYMTNLNSTQQFGMTFNSPVHLNGTNTVSHSFSSATFNSTIDGPGSLTINPNTAGGGGVTINNAVGGNTALSAFTITGENADIFINAPVTVTGAFNIDPNANFGSGSINLSGAPGTTITAGAVSFTAGDGINIDGYNINTTGNQVYNVAGQGGITSSNHFLVSDGDVNLTSTGGSISFTRNGTVATMRGDGVSPRTLTIDAAGTTTFSIPFATTNPIGVLDVTGNATLNVSPTTSGTQTYNDNVTLGTDATVTTTNSNVIFGGTVNGSGSRSLTINPGSGDVTFDGIVGGGTALSSLTVNGSGTSNLNASITTSAGQDYNTPVVVGNDIALTNTTSGVVDFVSTIDGTNNILTLNLVGVSNLITGVMSNMSLVKSGTGTLTLTGSNTYTGGTTISSGTLQLGNGASVGSIFGNVTNNGTLIFNRSDALTFSGVISGSGDVSHAGTNTLIFTGANTYTGTTNIASSTLQIGNGGTSGALGTGNVSNNGILTFNRSNAVSISNDISGTGSLVKDNASTLALSGVNTYTGDTTINDGSVVVAADSDLGNGGDLILNGGSLRNTSAFSTARDVILNASGGTFDTAADLTITGVVSGSGSLTKSSANILTLAANNTYTGGSVISAGTLQIGNGGTTGSISGAITNNGALIFNSSADSTLTNTITGSGTIEKDGTSMLTIGGTNNYSGTLTITNGTVVATSSSALGSTAAGTIIDSNGTLQLSDVAIGSEAITNNGGTISSSGTSTLSGNITLDADSTFDIQSGSFTLNGSVDDGASSFKLTKAGASELRLPGAHLHDGGIDLDAGILAVGANGSLGNGNLTVNGGSIAVTTADIDLSRNFILNTDLGLSGSNNFTISGDITGAGRAVNKAGDSVITLTGNNTFDAGLNIIAGTIIADGNNVLGSGVTSVGNNTTLQVADGRTITNTISLNGTGASGANGALVGVGSAAVSGNINLNTDAVIGTNAVSDTLTLSGNVNGAMALTFSGAGTVNITGNVGNVTAPTAITANTDLMVDGNITSNGHQTYNNPVALMGTSTFTVSGAGTQNINFNDNITGGQDLNLMGTGAGTYHFALNSGITQNNITVDGGGASTNNALTVANGSDQTFMLTGANTGDINGNTGVTGNFNFNNINNLTGGTGVDNFTLDGGTISGLVDGAGGTNGLTADNVTNTWNITSNNGGNVTGVGSFVNIQNLMGGTDVDTFNLNPGFTIAGLIDGGDVVNLNNIRFNTYSTRLDLFLSLPTGNVFDAGNVYAAGNVLVAGFNRVQQSDGNGIGVISLPDKENITVTYYDATLLNGEIGDPFYFYGWSVGNPPTPVTETNQPNSDIAAINNQPDINEQNNDGNSAAQINAAVGGNPITTNVLNTTKITPINDGNTVQAGPACYTTGN